MLQSDAKTGQLFFLNIFRKVVFVLLRMSRSEAIVDRIFAGNLDDLPPLSSKVSSQSGET
jgi:hypothetical protein